MAGVYDIDSGNELTTGLQGCNVCNEALQVAQGLADSMGRDVHLVDDDGEWAVHPAINGEREDADPIGSTSETILQETVQYWWDAQDPQNSGWYARVLDERGRETDDSMKVWFPVEVDEFGEDQADELDQALREAFPQAKIEAGL